METFVSDLLENADLGVITKKDVRVQYKNFLGRDISAEEKAKINDLVYSFVYYYASKQKISTETKPDSGVSSIGDKENKLKNQTKYIKGKEVTASQNSSFILKGHVTDKSNIKNSSKKNSPNKSPEYRERMGHNDGIDRSQRKVYPMRKRSLSSKIQLSEAVTAILVSDSESDSSSSSESSDSESDFDRDDESLQMAVRRLKDAREIKIQMSLARKRKKRAGFMSSGKNGVDSSHLKKEGETKKLDSKNPSLLNVNNSAKLSPNTEQSVIIRMHKRLEGEKKNTLGPCERVRTYNVPDKGAKHLVNEKNRTLNTSDKYRKQFDGEKNDKSHVGGKLNPHLSGVKKNGPIVISSSEESVILLSDLYSPQKMEEENNHGKNGGKIPNIPKKSTVTGANNEVKNRGKIPLIQKKSPLATETNSDDIRHTGKMLKIPQKSTDLKSGSGHVENGSKDPQLKSKILSSHSEISEQDGTVIPNSVNQLNNRTGTLTPSQTDDSGTLDVKKTPLTYSKPKTPRSAIKQGAITAKQLLKRKKKVETDSESEMEQPVNKKTKLLKGIKVQNRIASRNEIMKLVKKKREAVALLKQKKEKERVNESTCASDLPRLSHKCDKSDVCVESQSINSDKNKLNKDTLTETPVMNERVHALRESSSDIVSSELTDNYHESDSIVSSNGNSVIGEFGDSPPPLETDTDSHASLVIGADNSPTARDIGKVESATKVDSPTVPFTDTESPLKTTPGQLRKKKIRQMEFESDEDCLQKVQKSKKSRLMFNDPARESPMAKYGYNMPDEFTTIGGKPKPNKNGILIESEESSDEDEPLSRMRCKLTGVNTTSTTPRSAPESTAQSTPQLSTPVSTPFSTSQSTPQSTQMSTPLSTPQSTPQSLEQMNLSEPEYLQELRKICKASGIYIRTNRHFKGCTTDEEKIEALREALEDAGMEGEPTMKKGDELRLKREAGDFNTANIITTEGRGRRNVKSRYSSRPNDDSMSETPDKTKTPEKIDTELLDRLKAVVGSDDSE